MSDSADDRDSPAKRDLPAVRDSPAERMQKVCRVGALATILLIVTSNLFGRRLVNRFAVLNELAPLLEAGLILALLWFCVRFISSFPELSPVYKRGERTQFVAAACCLVALIIYSETLVELAVERVHFAKYGVLTFFFYFSDFLPLRFRNIAGAVAAAGLVGIVDESVQSIVPERYFDFRDMLLNLNGALFGGTLVWITTLYRPDLLQPKS